MKPIFPLSFLSCLIAVVAATAEPVDLTPCQHSYRVENFEFPDVRFSQGTMDILYAPPRKWICSGGGEHAALQPPEPGSSVRAEIIHHDKTPDFSFDEEGLKALRERALALLPGDPATTRLLSEVKSPIQINRHETMEYTYSTVLFGRNYRILVLLLPMEKEEFVFLLRAEEKEFDLGQRSFVRSLCSWRWEKTAPLNP